MPGIVRLRQIEGSLFGNANGVSKYNIYTLNKPDNFLDASDINLILERILPTAPEMKTWMKANFARNFIGQSFSGNTGEALSVGKNLSLQEIADTVGEDFAVTLAGPDWAKISSLTYMKMAEKNFKSIRTIFQSIADDRLTSIMKWDIERNGLGHMRGIIQNYWPLFMHENGGYVAERPYAVSDFYLEHREFLCPASELQDRLVEEGSLSSVFRMESHAGFGHSMGQAMMRLKQVQFESMEEEDACTVEVTPGGWHQQPPRLSRLSGLMHRPLLG